RYTHVRPSSHLRALTALRNLNCLVVHRAADPIVAGMAAMARRHDVPVIFDLDDAIYLRFNPLAVLVRRMIGRSDAVTAGSHSIAEYCSKYNENVNVITGWVDTDLFEPQQHYSSSPVPIIGWMGDGRVHERNLNLLVEPLLELARRETFKLKFVSTLGSAAIKEA